MSWQPPRSLDWEEPLAFASPFAGLDMALLYSGLQEAYTGGSSYLFLDPLDEKIGADWAELPPLPAAAEAVPLWVGYLGYGMRDAAERGSAGPIQLPDFRLIRYGHCFRFDHARRILEHYSQADAGPLTHGQARANTPAKVQYLCSNLTRGEYQRIVADTITQITDGNFYQANITRKFFGGFAETPDSWQLFSALTEASPAPYSAYIAHQGTAILSSSPECFLSIDAQGAMTTRPIKGSARRSEHAAEDKAIREQLAISSKNHAENLMIVDLMRNDLARVSTARTVEVIEQSALYSYRTIHHLISTVRAQKLPAISAYDAVRACFPAGSMTGAPKIAAMKWCTAQEKLERGVYSGVIGWFGGGDTCDLSVVIRTLILSGKHFEFQVGGGIVADSTPEDEWSETLAKARGILSVLGLSEADLAKL